MIHVFKSGNRHENVVLRYAGSQLTNVKPFTYLGLTLSSNGKFYQAQKSLAEQATEALFSLHVSHFCPFLVTNYLKKKKSAFLFQRN